MKGFLRKVPKTVVSVALSGLKYYLDIRCFFGLQVTKGKLINFFGEATDSAIE